MAAAMFANGSGQNEQPLIIFKIRYMLQFLVTNYIGAC